MSPVKVLIVDDSAMMRQLLVDILQQDPDISVAGFAPDPYVAWEKIKRFEPDVLTLDVEMPRMDGLTFLEKLMRAHPMPVVLISSLTEKGCETTLRALELGAVDFVTKPKVDVASGIVEQAEEIVEKVKTAARARIRRQCSSGAGERPVSVAAAPPLGLKTTQKVICIGASTGGTEALRMVLAALPADAPGTVVVQHMPARFTKSFAQHLDEASQMHVAEAKDGDRILQGHVLLAPGGLHMVVRRVGASYLVRVGAGQPVNRHCPSVDVLFRSAATHVGSNAIGVILTGMGGDGAGGLLEMRHAGARTIAEDESTCVVFGMPREAIVRGAAESVVPLDQVADEILVMCDAMV